MGVDVARGIALIGMLAANTFAVMENGRPTPAAMTVTGRSATLFVMVAGISLAFISGGRRPPRGPTRRAVAAGIVVRALLIAVIGLVLGHFDEDLSVILAYYGLFFLLAIPLLWLRPRTLFAVAGALVVVAPLVMLGSFALDLEAAFDGNPTLTSLFIDPLGLVEMLLVTGAYPAIVYLAYICVGLGIGRLDLSSTTVAVRLLVGGVVLAVTAWFTSSFLLFQLNGLAHLRDAAAGETDPAAVTQTILWDPEPVASWWWLALRGHHTGTPIDMVGTIGSALAVVGAALLVTRLLTARRLLWPLATAGSMTLTIYSVHAMVLNSGVLPDGDVAAYAVQVAVAVAAAVAWRRWRGQGPLEQFVAVASKRARHRVTERLRPPQEPQPEPVG